MEKALTFFFAAAPFVIGFLVWLTKKIFNHGGRITAIENEQEKMSIVRVPELLTDHEARIKILEKENETVNRKLDSVLTGLARLEGLLTAKKDKE